MKTRILAIALGAALIISGCAKKSYVGQWEGTLNMPDPKRTGGKSDPGKDMADALAKGIGGMLKSDLELKDDMTFKVTMLMMNIEGSYTQEDKKLTLTPKTINGQSLAAMGNPGGADKPLLLTANEDGTLSLTTEGRQGAPMVYRRKGEAK